MSYTGAKRLGLVGPGTANVKIEALGKEEEQNIDGQMMAVLVKPQSYSEGRFTVQVGSFGVKANAEAQAAKLEKMYDKARIVPVQLEKGLFYRVQVSETGTIGEALDLQKKLEQAGYKGCFIVTLDQ